MRFSELDQKIIAMGLKGHLDTEICEALDCKPYTVSSTLYRSRKHGRYVPTLHERKALRKRPAVL